MIALLALLRRRSKPVITPVSVTMFWFTCATLALLGTFAQVNPVWLVGPVPAGEHQRRVGARLVHGFP